MWQIWIRPVAFGKNCEDSMWMREIWETVLERSEVFWQALFQVEETAVWGGRVGGDDQVSGVEGGGVVSSLGLKFPHL